MDASHMIDIIANMSFRNGKVVFEDDRDTLKVYFQMMTQAFLLRRGLVLTYPEKHHECENRPCLALTCFLILKNYSSFDLSDVPSGICGCGFRHPEVWISRIETKLTNAIKSDRRLQEAIREVVSKLVAMELPGHESEHLRTVYHIESKQFKSISLPQFERDDVFFAPPGKKNTPYHPKHPRRETEAHRAPPNTSARVTAGRSWSHVASTQSFDKETIAAAAAASESKTEQLRRLLAQEEERLASLSDVKAELERKKKAEEEYAELQEKLAQVRARIQQAAGEAGFAPRRINFSGHAPVILGKKREAVPAVAPTSPQGEQEAPNSGANAGESE